MFKLPASQGPTGCTKQLRRACLFATVGLLPLGLLTGCVSYKPVPVDVGRSAVDFESRSLRDWSGTQGKWTLPKLTQAGFHFHPSLAEARAEVAVADAAVLTAGQRPNPSATFAPEYNFTTASPSPWIWGLSVDIPIETAGKRAIRVLKAQAEANAARCKLASAAHKVRNGVRMAVIDLAAADARVALLEEQRHIQEDLVKVLKDRVGAGETPHTELTTYQLALNRAALDVSAARRDAGKARATLGSALGLPAKAVIGLKPAFDLAVVNMPDNAACRSALKTHPEVLGALADYAAAEAALKLEVARQYPDLKLSNGFQWDQGD
ncbi:MAG: outer membrane protein, partial [Verrucomicrobiaceae bacterium]|nr:outer membrane protein [Verrucomicrobiaceae bacterium]